MDEGGDGMLLLAFLLLLTGLCFMPLRATIDVHRRERTLLRLHLHYGIVQRQWRLEVLHTPQGRQLRTRQSDGQWRPARLPTSHGKRWLQFLRKEKRARRFLLRRIHVDRLDAQLLLHLPSASSTALLTGAARNAAALLPVKWRSRLRLAIRPDFLYDRTTLNVRCILHIRPGTLFITAGLMLWAWARQQIHHAREALPKWNILSEN